MISYRDKMQSFPQKKKKKEKDKMQSRIKKSIDFFFKTSTVKQYYDLY